MFSHYSFPLALQLYEAELRELFKHVSLSTFQTLNWVCLSARSVCVCLMLLVDWSKLRLPKCVVFVIGCVVLWAYMTFVACRNSKHWIMWTCCNNIRCFFISFSVYFEWTVLTFLHSASVIQSKIIMQPQYWHYLAPTLLCVFSVRRSSFSKEYCVWLLKCCSYLISFGEHFLKSLHCTSNAFHHLWLTRHRKQHLDIVKHPSHRQ